MKKLAILFVIPLFLSGCFYQTVNQNDIAAAMYICAKRNTQVYVISADFIGEENVTCTDRSIHKITHNALTM